MEHIWEIVSYLATAFAGSFFGWLFGRRREKAEVEGVRVQNFDAALEAYKKMYEDMIEDLKDQNEDLKGQVESLKQELSENRKQIITLTNFVLASAMKRADDATDFTELKEILK